MRGYATGTEILIGDRSI
uniref:Uncharacterized protein n=1 Tax=Anguilla anguilla TaxID=7936 RepID=A0A0E9R094_ANGAN